MGIFDGFADFLKGSVGNNMDNDPKDVRNTKRNIKNTGHFEDDTENDFLTRELDTGIKAFQQNNGLRVDGRVFPKGETEREIFRKVEKRDPDETFGLIDKINEQSIGFGGDVSGVITPIVPSPEDKPNPLALRDNTAQEDKQPEGKFVQTASGMIVNPEAILQRLAQAQEKSTEPEASENSDDKLAQTDTKPTQFDATGRMIREESNIPVPEKKPLDSPFRPPILEGVDNEEAKDSIIEEEDEKFHLYKDTAEGGGKVTVGVGILLPDVEAAMRLPFTLPDGQDGRRRATPEEIERAFNKVDAIKQPDNGGKHTANAFDPESDGNLNKEHNFDDLRLPLEVSGRLLDERLRVDVSGLRKSFPEFDSFSPKRQKGLLDMHFNLGPTKFTRDNWPNLFEAIEKGDWQRAAKESHRIEKGSKGIKGRNNRTRDKLLDGLPPLN